jgi:RNA polymerase sigma factor (sigma-70 family)
LTDSGDQRLDSDTVAALYAEHASHLKPFLIGLLRDGGLAEEALQSTFQKTLLKGGEVDARRWKAWLFQVAYREAMAIRRRQQIDARAMQQIARTRPRFGLPVTDESIAAEQRDRLQRAIEGLPVDQQTVVLYRIQHELTFQQIADKLGIPLGTVLTRMRLALRRLRKAIRDSSG